MENKISIVAFTIFIVILFQISAHAQMGSSTTKKSGPLPSPNVEGLDEFQKMLVFASRNIEEGFYAGAIDDLKNAEMLRQDDPLLYEMFGIVYDADRQSNKAYGYFKRAGEMYLKADNMDKSWAMLGWMRTIQYNSKEVIDFEKKLKERQEVINSRRFK